MTSPFQTGNIREGAFNFIKSGIFLEDTSRSVDAGNKRSLKGAAECIIFSSDFVRGLLLGALERGLIGYVATHAGTFSFSRLDFRAG